jgi:hypothetical protein
MKSRIAAFGTLLFIVLVLGGCGHQPASDPNGDLADAPLKGELYEIKNGKEVPVQVEPDPIMTDGPIIAPDPTTSPVPSPSAAPAPAPAPVPDPAPVNPGSLTVGGIDIGAIVSIGEKIWGIIEANRPVVNQSYTALSAIPRGITSWDELENWDAPTSRVYKLVYKNLFKATVVDFEYRVVYTTNGDFNGSGKYLSQVEIQPSKLTVAWGYKFNATGAVVSVTNAGSKENPLAAVELSLDWSVETTLKHMGQSVRYYIRGDGLFKNLSDGTVTAGSLK